MDSFVRVSKESGIPLKGLLEFVQQVEMGASIAFLCRYRADLCGGLDEESVHSIFRKLEDQQELIDRRISMLTTLRQRGVLTPELKSQIEGAADRQELNDVFAPYRARKRGPADEAFEKGLDPLARMLWAQEEGLDIQGQIAQYVDPGKGLASEGESLAGAYAIAARWLGEKPEVLRELRKLCRLHCETVVSANARGRKEPRYQASDSAPRPRRFRGRNGWPFAGACAPDCSRHMPKSPRARCPSTWSDALSRIRNPRTRPI